MCALFRLATRKGSRPSAVDDGKHGKGMVLHNEKGRKVLPWMMGRIQKGPKDLF